MPTFPRPTVMCHCSYEKSRAAHDQPAGLAKADLARRTETCIVAPTRALMDIIRSTRAHIVGGSLWFYCSAFKSQHPRNEWSCIA